MTAEFTVAVHALVYLHHKNTVLSSEELAQNVCTNPARIRKVMAKLKKAGLVLAREGRVQGGYACAQGAEEITLEQIFCAVEDRVANCFRALRVYNSGVVKSVWRSGDPEMSCLVASGMASVMDELYDELDNLCKQRLSRVTVKEIEQNLFRQKA